MSTVALGRVLRGFIALPGDLNWLSGPEFVYQAAHAVSRAAVTYSKPKATDFAITEGEDIGIVDTSLPVGTGASQSPLPGTILGAVTTGEGVPPVDLGSLPGIIGGFVDESDDQEAVFPPGSIFAPGEVWGSDRREPDFPDDETPNGAVVIPPTASGGDELEPNTTEESQVADWGDIISGVIDVFQGQPVGGTVSTAVQPGAQFVAPAAGTSGSQYYVNANGQVVRRCRRRRRRLLTPTDLSDLAALQALVGKGSSALNMAVAKAVRR